MRFGGCSAGRNLPESWRAISCFVALRAASVGPENETRPSGVKGGTWVEKAELADGRRDQSQAGQRKRRADSSDGQDTKPGTGTKDGLATRPLSTLGCRVRALPRSSVVTRIGRSDWARTTAWPGRDDW